MNFSLLRSSVDRTMRTLSIITKLVVSIELSGQPVFGPQAIIGSVTARNQTP